MFFRYRGKSKYYPGKIARDNRDDTYDVNYDDGEKERGVKANLIKKIGGGGTSDSEAEANFSRGDKVEARYKGKSKYYKGEIGRDNRDGTYNVNYDDGEKERGVKANLIKSLEKSKSPKKKSRNDYDSEEEGGSDIQEGDKIEALYKGKGTKWYKGKVTSAKRDGSFDVEYEDGDRESGVLAKNIKSLEKKSPKKKSRRDVSDTEDEASFSRGDKVEAR